MTNRPKPIAAVKPLANSGNPGGAPTGNRRRQAHEPLDAINRAIIVELQHDGRKSYTAIAEKVGLSEAAVRQRVQRLTDDGVMQIVAVTDPLTLGFGFIWSTWWQADSCGCVEMSLGKPPNQVAVSI